MIDGKKYTELEIRKNKDAMLKEFRFRNASEQAEELLGIDPAFVAYKKEIDDFLENASLVDLEKACNSISERLELAKLRRRDGHTAWDSENK